MKELVTLWRWLTPDHADPVNSAPWHLVGLMMASACTGVDRDYGVGNSGVAATGTTTGTAAISSAVTSSAAISSAVTSSAPLASPLVTAAPDAGNPDAPRPNPSTPDEREPDSTVESSDAGASPALPDADVATTPEPMTSGAPPTSASASDAVVTSASVAPPPATSAVPEPEPEPEPIIPTLLVFSKTTAFQHESTELGVVALRQLAVDNGWVFDVTDDAAEFTDAGLAPFNVVVFLNTSGEVLDDAQQAAMERFIQAGHGFVGVHQAAYTELNWAWYGELVGARFSVHASNTQDATVVVETTAHPSTGHLPSTWMHHDEWYAFTENPRSQVHVLLSVDEASYTPGGATMGDHPIAWHHEYDGGRAFYTGLGHTEESYAEADFLEHLAGGIQWASGAAPESCGNFLLDRGEACDDGDTSNATPECDATCSGPV